MRWRSGTLPGPHDAGTGEHEHAERREVAGQRDGASRSAIDHERLGARRGRCREVQPEVDRDGAVEVGHRPLGDDRRQVGGVVDGEHVGHGADVRGDAAGASR